MPDNEEITYTYSEITDRLIHLNKTNLIYNDCSKDDRKRDYTAHGSFGYFLIVIVIVATAFIETAKELGVLSLFPTSLA